MYFVVAVFTFAMYVFIIGFNTILSSDFNIFEDPFFILIIIFWILLLSLLQHLLNKLIYFFDIWGCQQFSEHPGGMSEQPKDMDVDELTGLSLMPSSPHIFTYKMVS